MRALIIEQDPTEKAALVGEVLEARGFNLEAVVVQSDPAQPGGRAVFPDPTQFDLIVPMGSPWSVYDDRIAEWIKPELEMIGEAVDRKIPVFGICFGAQALSAAVGGSVQPTKAVEIGWHEVISDIPELAGEWFQWHGDVFTVPPSATLLASSPVGPQAFQVSNSVGVQFHPEIDALHLAGWLSEGGACEMERVGADPEALLKETRRRNHQLVDRVDALLGWFFDDVAGL